MLWLIMPHCQRKESLGSLFFHQKLSAPKSCCFAVDYDDKQRGKRGMFVEKYQGTQPRPTTQKGKIPQGSTSAVFCCVNVFRRTSINASKWSDFPLNSAPHLNSACAFWVYNSVAVEQKQLNRWRAEEDFRSRQYSQHQGASQVSGVTNISQPTKIPKISRRNDRFFRPLAESGAANVSHSDVVVDIPICGSVNGSAASTLISGLVMSAYCCDRQRRRRCSQLDARGAAHPALYTRRGRLHTWRPHLLRYDLAQRRNQTCLRGHGGTTKVSGLYKYW